MYLLILWKERSSVIMHQKICCHLISCVFSVGMKTIDCCVLWSVWWFAFYWCFLWALDAGESTWRGDTVDWGKWWILTHWQLSSRPTASFFCSPWKINNATSNVIVTLLRSKSVYEKCLTRDLYRAYYFVCQFKGQPFYFWNSYYLSYKPVVWLYNNRKQLSFQTYGQYLEKQVK